MVARPEETNPESITQQLATPEDPLFIAGALSYSLDSQSVHPLTSSRSRPSTEDPAGQVVGSLNHTEAVESIPYVLSPSDDRPPLTRDNNQLHSSAQNPVTLPAASPKMDAFSPMSRFTVDVNAHGAKQLEAVPPSTVQLPPTRTIGQAGTRVVGIKSLTKNVSPIPGSFRPNQPSQVVCRRELYKRHRDHLNNDNEVIKDQMDRYFKNTYGRTNERAEGASEELSDF